LTNTRSAVTRNPARLEVQIYELADVLYRQAQFAAAEPLYREILQSRQARLQPEDEDVLSAATSLGRLLADWAWAERTNALAVVDRAREGARFLRDCLAIRLRGTNATHWRTADLQSRLGGALLTLAVTEPALSTVVRDGTFTEAESALLQSQTALQGNKRAELRYKRDALTRLARLYEAWDKPQLAAEWRQKLESFDQRQTSKEPASTGQK
jgi:hypothetical protein